MSKRWCKPLAQSDVELESDEVDADPFLFAQTSSHMCEYCFDTGCKPAAINCQALRSKHGDLIVVQWFERVPGVNRSCDMRGCRLPGLVTRNSILSLLRINMAFRVVPGVNLIDEIVEKQHLSLKFEEM